MPRKGVVSPEQVLKTLLNYDIYDNNMLRNVRDPIWKEICKIHNNLLNPKSLHIYVMQDRHNCQTLYRKHKGLSELVSELPKLMELAPEIEEFEILADDNNHKDGGHEFVPYEIKRWSWEKKCKIKKKLTFDITFTPEQWNQISPIKKISNNGMESLALQVGWTDVFRDVIWHSQKLPCSFSFQWHCVDKFDAYIKVIGKCVSCNGHISAMCLKKPMKDEPVIFAVITADSRTIPHIKRIPFKRLTKVKKKLKRKNPQQWRTEKVEMAMKKGHCELPFLYDLPILKKGNKQSKKTTKSKIQQEKKISEPFPKTNISSTTIDMQADTENDLFQCLYDIHQKTNCKRFVKSIRFDKFHVTYWSPEQVKMHNDVQTLLGHSLYLDTTTRIAQNIKIDGNDEISLSVLYTYFDNKLVPLSQALSEKNDFAFYTSWLMDWKESVIEIPKQIVTNMHKIIQDAVCMTLNGMCFSMYNDLCLQILSGKEVLTIIPTQIKTNLAHFEYTILNWSCLSHLRPKIKEFYKKSIRFITTIENLSMFSQFLKYFMIVSSSKIYHEQCQKAVRYLITLMQSYNFHQHANKIVNACENIDDIKKLQIRKSEANLHIKCKFLNDFIDKVKEDVEFIVNSNDEDDLGTQDNDYYIPEFADKFYNLCEEFPCWTNVMHNYFNNSRDIPTLRESKIYFKNFKNSLGEPLLRVDKVLLKHCYDISKEIKITATALNNFVKQEIIEDCYCDASESEILHCEGNHQSNEIFQPENNHEYMEQEIKCEQLSIFPQKTIIQQNMLMINQNQTVTQSKTLQNYRVLYVYDPENQHKKVHVERNEVNFENVNICKNFIFTS